MKTVDFDAFKNTQIEHIIATAPDGGCSVNTQSYFGFPNLLAQQPKFVVYDSSFLMIKLIKNK